MSTLTYLNLAGVPGDSLSRAFPKQFEVLSLGFGASLPVTSKGSGSGSGKPSLSAVTATIRDYNLPLLLKTLTQGRTVASAAFSLVLSNDATARPYEIITLGDVVVDGLAYSQSGDTPILELSLAYRTIRIESTRATLPAYTFDIGRNTGS